MPPKQQNPSPWPFSRKQGTELNQKTGSCPRDEALWVGGIGVGWGSVSVWAGLASAMGAIRAASVAVKATGPKLLLSNKALSSNCLKMNQRDFFTWGWRWSLENLIKTSLRTPPQCCLLATFLLSCTLKGKCPVLAVPSRDSQGRGWRLLEATAFCLPEPLWADCTLDPRRPDLSVLGRLFQNLGMVKVEGDWWMSVRDLWPKCHHLGKGNGLANLQALPRCAWVNNTAWVILQRSYATGADSFRLWSALCEPSLLACLQMKNSPQTKQSRENRKQTWGSSSFV